MDSEQINTAMNNLLDSCDGTAYPYICRKIKTAAGKRYVKGRMVQLVTEDGITPLSATLPHIEQELEGL